LLALLDQAAANHISADAKEYLHTEQTELLKWPDDSDEMHPIPRVAVRYDMTYQDRRNCHEPPRVNVLNTGSFIHCFLVD
jgi:hypothetical protein